MKSLQVLGLLIILTFSSTVFAEKRNDLKIDKSQTVAYAAILNPFRPLIDIFKKILRIKPKSNGGCPNIVANVEDILLSKNEIFIRKTQNIEVHTVATDLDNDPLFYSYVVSGGKILAIEGTGESKLSLTIPNSYTIFTTKNHIDGGKVIWDLSGVKPGTYTITAAVDDGCGFCGKTQTKTIVVKE